MTTGASAINACAIGLYTALNVAGFTTLAPGGIRDAIPANPSYPYCWYTLREDPTPVETFGKMLQIVEARLQFYDVEGPAVTGTRRIDLAIDKAAELLQHVALDLTASGWRSLLLEYAGAYPLPNLTNEANELIRTKLAIFRWHVEKA